MEEEGGRRKEEGVEEWRRKEEGVEEWRRKEWRSKVIKTIVLS